MNCLGAGT